MTRATSWEELFSGEENRAKSFLHDIFTPASGALLGFGMACFLNFGTRRPIFSGIQKHFTFAGVGALIGKTVDGWRSDYLAERDAMYRHYIQLHPEDFPFPEPKKYADILDEWVPVR